LRNFYSITTNQAEIIALFRVINRYGLMLSAFRHWVAAALSLFASASVALPADLVGRGQNHRRLHAGH
jgi:hypothetical protein